MLANFSFLFFFLFCCCFVLFLTNRLSPLNRGTCERLVKCYLTLLFFFFLRFFFGF